MADGIKKTTGFWKFVVNSITISKDNNVVLYPSLNNRVTEVYLTVDDLQAFENPNYTFSISKYNMDMFSYSISNRFYSIIGSPITTIINFSLSSFAVRLINESNNCTIRGKIYFTPKETMKSYIEFNQRKENNSWVHYTYEIKRNNKIHAELFTNSKLKSNKENLKYTDTEYYNIDNWDYNYVVWHNY